MTNAITITTTKKTFVFITILVFCSSTFAEITPLQQQVLDDYKAMLHMNEKQRQEYRNNRDKSKSTADLKAYTQAFKAVRPILPEYLGITEDPLKSKRKSTPKTNTNKNLKISGTFIQYDSGNVTGGAGVASQMVGNRFDSALNPAGTMCCFPVEASGSITMVTFYMNNTFFNSAVLSLYSDIMGTRAMQVTSMAFAGRNTGLNTITLGTATMNAYQNGAFLAGIWQFDPTMTALGVDTGGTTGGQGYHAISLNDGAVGTMLMDLTMLNAVFRVKGNVSTPVELLNFTIE